MEFPMQPMGRSSVLEEVGESSVPAPVPMAPTGAGMLTLLQVVGDCILQDSIRLHSLSQRAHAQPDSPCWRWERVNGSAAEGRDEQSLRSGGGTVKSQLICQPAMSTDGQICAEDLRPEQRRESLPQASMVKKVCSSIE
ncbi:hypothetical protein VPH35_124781 [Triticum aestivum]